MIIFFGCRRVLVFTAVGSYTPVRVRISLFGSIKSVRYKTCEVGLWPIGMISLLSVWPPAKWSIMS